MNTQQLWEMPGEELLSLWSARRALGPLPRVGPGNARAISYEPPTGGSDDSEGYVAAWVNDHIHPWLPALVAIFHDGATVADARLSIGRRMEFYTGWSRPTRHRFQRRIGKPFKRLIPFGLAAIEDAVKAIEAAKVDYPIDLGEFRNAPDPDAVALARMQVERRKLAEAGGNGN